MSKYNKLVPDCLKARLFKVPKPEQSTLHKRKKRAIGVESRTDVSNEAATELFQHLGQVSDQPAGSSGSGQPAGKTAEQLEMEQIEKARIAQAKKDKKKADAELPVNKAKTWVSMLASKINQIKDKIAQTEVTAKNKIAAEVRAVYNKRLHTHVGELEDLKRAIDAVRMGGNNDSITEHLSNAGILTDSVKSALHEWNGLMNCHKRDDKTSGSAEAA